MAYRCYCGRLFGSREALYQHQEAKGHDWSCPECGKSFVESQSLAQHQEATKHGMCCDIIFSTESELAKHEDSCHNWKCSSCSRIFQTEQSLAQHEKDSSHHKCGECFEVFANSYSLALHMQVANHVTEFACCDCDRKFGSLMSLDQHVASKYHASCKKAYKCRLCNRSFGSQEMLGKHEASFVHKPPRMVPCLAAKTFTCKKLFDSPAGMLQHLESGCCSSGMDRHKLNALVVTHDDDRVITDANPAVHGTLLMEASARLLTQAAVREVTPGRVEDAADDDIPEVTAETTETTCSTPSADSESGGAILTPRSGSTPTASTFSAPCGAIRTPCTSSIGGTWIVSGLMTPISGDGVGIDLSAMASSLESSLRCPLCSPARAAFGSVKALQNHLRSAAHAPVIFHCPEFLVAKDQHAALTKKQYFSTLSGLMQHIESGVCGDERKGMMEALAYLEGRLRAFGLTVGIKGLTEVKMER